MSQESRLLAKRPLVKKIRILVASLLVTGLSLRSTFSHAKRGLFAHSGILAFGTCGHLRAIRLIDRRVARSRARRFGVVGPTRAKRLVVQTAIMDRFVSGIP